ncbi:helix-turn-helix domain-containing protein [Paraburkholderia sp. ZP32-5]|uniref:helix-turn-helix domain-containing protein n=1 Tax=Paraburkholderia sp. ZP32-5 TaxID=2883245 RepID=UPI003FA39802
MHVSQSVSTMQIGALQAQRGVPLFDRGRRKARLTFIGENPTDIAGRVAERIDEFGSAARECAGLRRCVRRPACSWCSAYP